MKKSRGVVKERLPTQIPREVIKNMNEYFKPNNGINRNLKDIALKHKKEYQNCLSDFVRFLGKNKEKKFVNSKNSLKGKKTGF